MCLVMVRVFVLVVVSLVGDDKAGFAESFLSHTTPAHTGDRSHCALLP